MTKRGDPEPSCRRPSPSARMPGSTARRSSRSSPTSAPGEWWSWSPSTEASVASGPTTPPCVRSLLPIPAWPWPTGTPRSKARPASCWSDGIHPSPHRPAPLRQDHRTALARLTTRRTQRHLPPFPGCPARDPQGRTWGSVGASAVRHPPGHVTCAHMWLSDFGQGSDLRGSWPRSCLLVSLHQQQQRPEHDRQYVQCCSGWKTSSSLPAWNSSAEDDLRGLSSSTGTGGALPGLWCPHFQGQGASAGAGQGPSRVRAGRRAVVAQAAP